MPVVNQTQSPHELQRHVAVNRVQYEFVGVLSLLDLYSCCLEDAAMQTEFPRTGVLAEQTSAASIGATGMDAKECAPAAFDASALTLSDDDLALIDWRYSQFMALAELDHLMDDL